MPGADGSFEIDPRQFMAPEEREGPHQSDGVHDEGLELGRIEDELNDVEAALDRLDSGAYGMCDSCGAPIAEARLAADPLQRFCEPHAPTGAP